MPAPKKYSDELRERATRLALESGRPIAQVARDLGVHKDSPGIPALFLKPLLSRTASMRPIC